MKSFIIALLLLGVVVQPTEGIFGAIATLIATVGTTLLSRTINKRVVSERGVEEVDLNGDGQLDMAELTQEYGALGAKELMHFADSNGDRVLEQDEIVELEKYADSHT